MTIRSGLKGGEHAFAKSELFGDPDARMPEHPLTQLPCPTDAPAAVCESKVVEHEQLPGGQADLELDILDAQRVPPEELDL